MKFRTDTLKLIKKVYQRCQNKLLDAIFPIQCISCQKPNVYICSLCLQKIKISNSIIYSTTSLPALTSCDICGIMTTANYQESLHFKTAIHLFKYQGIKEIGEQLGLLMRKRIQTFINNNPYTWLVIPIPLHRRKQLERGFNQNEILAKACFKSMPSVKILMDKFNPLKKVKYTLSQTKLTSQQRIINVKQVFKVINREMIHDQNIIIIDDVITTGATLKEAATTLKAAGAKQIWGLVLAKD